MQSLHLAKRTSGLAAPLSRTLRAATGDGGAQSLRGSRCLTQMRALQKPAAAEAVRMADPPPMAYAETSWAKTKPQLDTLKQAYKAKFYETISEIMTLRQKYLEDRYIFVEGRKMEQLLKGLGARDEDFEAIQKVSDNLVGDPTLLYRKSRNGRFCFDFDTLTVRRLEFQPFILSVEEDFKRYDSNVVREFDEVEDELQLNTVYQGLMVFKALLFHGMPTNSRAKLDYETNKWVLTIFSVRTVTTPALLGEPALEGVHTDGVDHTMTTYLGSRNMRPESAVTFLHDMREKTGIRFNETDPGLISGRVHHRHFLDTAVIVDTELKHSLSPVYAVDPSREATRDMLVFFTRRPVTKDHVSAPYDSLNPHKTMPMEIPLYVPRSK